MIRTIMGFAIGLMLLVGEASAQPIPGDLVITTLPYGAGNCSFMAVTPGGTPRTFCTVPAAGWFVYAITMDSNNQDLVVAGGDLIAQRAFLGRVSPGGAATTIAALPGSQVEDVVVDEDGTYLVPLSVWPQLALVRVTPGGVVTSIVPTPASPGGSARAIAKEIGSGDAVVLDTGLYRIPRTGNRQVVTWNLRSAYSFDLLSDPRTGTLVVSQDQSVIHVNPTQGQVTTLAAGLGCAFVAALTYEHRTDTFVMAAYGGRGGLFRVARNGLVTTLLANMWSFGLESYGSRNVAGIAAPQVGTVFPLRFSEPGQPNAPYLAAASFATRPGIPLRIGVIDLRPDPLMALSLTTPAIFRGFAGQLDATGAVNASIVIPGSAAIQGTRFFVSFVTYTAGGVKSIANTAGFTIR